ncbi:acyltransferase [uncultured Sphingomonas sp.]|uniref:acyltransferase family protein n=1 Tax=uncultured Sphingomonas sp. TaxID=158754 RepID=UPI0025ED82D5|nr:acyltransferase [uncultured Sphingomonas sp.]
MRQMPPLQTGRGLAALAVTIFHAALSARDFVGGAPDWSPLLKFGALGVDFFFLLSGFLIYWTTVDKVGQPGWLRHYIVARISRIYIPYLPVGLAMAATFTFLPGLSKGTIGWDWQTTITLVGDDSALAVAWSLKHEVAFYALMGVLFTSRRMAIGLVIWAAVVLSLWLPKGRDAVPLLSPWSLEFIAGVIFAAVVRKGFAHRVSRWLHRSQPMLLTSLGDMSFALYLVHSPILSVTTRAAAVIGLDWYGAMVFGTLCSIAGGYAYHRFWERPALAAVRAYADNGAISLKTAPAPTAPPAVQMKPGGPPAVGDKYQNCSPWM